MSTTDAAGGNRQDRMLGAVAEAAALPRGCAPGYMPELNVMCGVADCTTQTGQPATKHRIVGITPSSASG